MFHVTNYLRRIVPRLPRGVGASSNQNIKILISCLKIAKTVDKSGLEPETPRSQPMLSGCDNQLHHMPYVNKTLYYPHIADMAHWTYFIDSDS